MNEQEFREQLYKYIDGELSEQQKLEFEALLENDPLYKMELEKEQKFDHLIKAHSIKEKAPFALKEQIIEELSRKNKVVLFIERLSSLRFLKPATITLISCVFIFSIFLKPSESFPLFSQSIDRHMDVLKGSYPMEIVSNDVDEVAVWFEGKLDFAVMVPDMKIKGCELTGARICRLNDKKVALLTYQYRGNKITAIVMDTDDVKIPKARKVANKNQTFYSKSDNGYQSVLCLSPRHEGVGCIYVSELPEDEIMDLVKM